MTRMRSPKLSAASSLYGEVLRAMDNHHHSNAKWKPIMLENLFSGTKHKTTSQSKTIEVEKETMAEEMEDERLDDGAIEINSDEVSVIVLI